MTNVPEHLIKKLEILINNRYAKYGWVDLDGVMSDTLLDVITNYNPKKSDLYAYMIWRSHYNVLTKLSEASDGLTFRSDFSDYFDITDTSLRPDDSERAEFIEAAIKAMNSIVSSRKLPAWNVSAFRLMVFEGASLSKLALKFSKTPSSVGQAIRSVSKELRERLIDWQNFQFKTWKVSYNSETDSEERFSHEC